VFSRELGFFIEHQDDLVEKYRGRVLVLRGESVEGDFESALAAYLFAKDRFAPGTYMIQPCAPGREAYTVTISSSAAW
jgi:hypothetical protein